MKIMIILCHPRKGSFNHVLFQHLTEALDQNGVFYTAHDLYEEEFNPLLTAEEINQDFSFDTRVIEHTRELRAAECLVIIHPDWWGQPPALLKGWIDRVFRPGVAYEYRGEEFMPKTYTPLLDGKRAFVFCTTDKKEASHPHPLEALWKESVLEICGFAPVECRIFHNLFESEYKERKSWLEEGVNLVLSTEA